MFAANVRPQLATVPNTCHEHVATIENGVTQHIRAATKFRRPLAKPARGAPLLGFPAIAFAA
jgi:hypothetical protein